MMLPRLDPNHDHRCSRDIVHPSLKKSIVVPSRLCLISFAAAFSGALTMRLNRNQIVERAKDGYQEFLTKKMRLDVGKPLQTIWAVW